MNKIQTVSTILGYIILIIILVFAGSFLQKISDDENMTYLHKIINEKDSIIKIQEDYIIQLTYQHEDDDALFEEEQP